MIEWMAMKGYGLYVWSSYGMIALCVLLEVLALRRRRQAALAAAEPESEPESP